MTYFNCNSERIIIDEQLNIDKFNWKSGDYFKLTNVNGQVMLVKVDPLIAFVRNGADELFNNK